MRKTRLLEEMRLNEKDGIELLKFATYSKKLVRISEDLHYNPEQIEIILEILRGFFEKNPDINVIKFKELMDVSRKYAIDLLEYFDSQLITIRKENIRVPGKLFELYGGSSLSAFKSLVTGAMEISPSMLLGTILLAIKIFLCL